MSAPGLVLHQHIPLYRVARREWPDPLDASFSQTVDDNRWNTREFPALYCCCSEPVARANVLDRLRAGSMNLEDLTPEIFPQLVELDWSGQVVDAASDAGLAAAGLPTSYPDAVTVGQCQQAAASWHAARAEGVLCRSAAVHRIQPPPHWTEPHQPWGEVAIYTRHARADPRIRRRRDDAWLRPGRGLGTPGA